MQTSSSVRSYRAADVLSATPGRLLLITFDALIAALTRARVGTTMADAGVAGSGLERARLLVGELLATLNREAGGDLADRLAAIYVFLLSDLATLAIAPDAGRLARHTELVRELRDAFAVAAEQPTAKVS